MFSQGGVGPSLPFLDSRFVGKDEICVAVARDFARALSENQKAGMFLAYVSPLGRSLVDKGLYLPESWTSDPGHCAAAGVPEELPVEDGVGLGAAGASLGAGPPQGRVGWPETTPSGCRRPSGRPWRPWGCATCWTFRAAHRSGPWSWPGPVRNIRGSGAPANPSSGTGSVVPWSSAVMSCRMRPGGR